MTPLQHKILLVMQENHRLGKPKKDMSSVIFEVGMGSEPKTKQEGVRNAIRTLDEQGWLDSDKSSRPHQYWLKPEFSKTPFSELEISHEG